MVGTWTELLQLREDMAAWWLPPAGGRARWGGGWAGGPGAGQPSPGPGELPKELLKMTFFFSNSLRIGHQWQISTTSPTPSQIVYSFLKKLS